MPEGPSIVILKELIEPLQLVGKTVNSVAGNTSIDKERMLHQEVKAIRSWGKHFLICFENFSLRIHFMLFGSYRINERKESAARLTLQFDDAELNFYACSVQYVEGDSGDTYDWSADVMSPDWDPEQAKAKLRNNPRMLACDALLNQDIFAGVGNIIKNEVLYRIHVHPASEVGALPDELLQALTDEASHYSFQFLEWKKEFTLKKHWLAHTKKICHRCELPMQKIHMGKTNRRTFFCTNCQQLYTLTSSK